MQYFQDLIQKLNNYWADQGCLIESGYDLEVGAGTFNPSTFFRTLGPEPYKCAYLEPSRRPTDGRYGSNPSRMQKFCQYQVMIKPGSNNAQKLYLDSLKAIGFHIKDHDIRFVHDDWKSPTLGAWGLGWEVWINGMEVSQFTYFQNVGGIDLKVIPVEITYGLERLAMYIQKVDSVYDLKWNKEISYFEMFHQNELEFSTYNYEKSSHGMWQRHFDDYENEAKMLIEEKLPLPAYDFVMKASHAFNMLEAKGVISVTLRADYIRRIRNLSCAVAKEYVQIREALNYPLLKEKTKKASSTVELDIPKFNQKNKEDFVLEILSEELPHSFVPIGIKNLERHFKNLLKEYNLNYKELKVYGTPRRLSVVIDDLDEATPSKSEEKKGPPASRAFDESGLLTQIGKGFFKSQDLRDLSLEEVSSGKNKALTLKEIKGEKYIFLQKEVTSKSSYEILASELPKLIKDLDFPQKMRFGSSDILYPRPIKSICALLDNYIIPFTVGDIVSSNKSCGHPALANTTFTIKKAKDYLNEIAEHKIILNQNERKEKILDQIEKFEKKLNIKAIKLDEVLKQVTHLCEYPNVALGEFDKEFLKAPKELLSLVMVEHQKYFPVENKNGQLTNQFLVCLDNLENHEMVLGHQRALSPRLADGLFLYDKDLNLGLKNFSEQLKNMTFQKGLGSMTDKSNRLFENAKIIQSYLPQLESQHIENAKDLLKADLASHVVYDFPELQGIMGKHYSELEEHPQEISSAILEHWRPNFEGDLLPITDLGILYSLSDKIDNILACYLSNKIPTSSSDPFAIRRQTIGIIKILLEHRLHLDLATIFHECAKHYEKELSDETLKQIINFFEARLKTILSQYDIKPDEVQAVLQKPLQDPYDTYLKAKALNHFKTEKQFLPLFEVYKRAQGQLNAPVKKPVDQNLFKTKEEEALYSYLKSLKVEFLQSLKNRFYEESFYLLSSLQGHLAALFDNVKIMDEDENIRLNRLSLLNEVTLFFKELLDFSKVVED